MREGEGEGGRVGESREGGKGREGRTELRLQTFL